MLVGWVHVWPKASTIETFIEYIQFGFAWGGWQGLQDLQTCEPPLCANWWVKMSRAPKEPDCLEPDRDTTHLSSQKDQLKDCCLTVSIHLFWRQAMMLWSTVQDFGQYASGMVSWKLLKSGPWCTEELAPSLASELHLRPGCFTLHQS